MNEMPPASVSSVRQFFGKTHPLTSAHMADLRIAESRQEVIQQRKQRLLHLESQKREDEEEQVKRKMEVEAKGRATPGSSRGYRRIKKFGNELRLSPVRHLNPDYKPVLREVVEEEHRRAVRVDDEDKDFGLADWQGVDHDVVITEADLRGPPTNKPHSLAQRPATTVQFSPTTPQSRATAVFSRPAHPSSFYPGASPDLKPTEAPVRVNAWRIDRLSRLAGRQIDTSGLVSVPPSRMRPATVMERRPPSQKRSTPVSRMEMIGTKVAPTKRQRSNDPTDSPFTPLPLLEPGEAKRIFKKRDLSSDVPSFLPLDVFDDRSLDTHEPEEWLDMIQVSNEVDDAGNTRHIVKGVAAFSRFTVNSEGLMEWRPCSVISYDSKKELFTIMWHHDGSRKNVTRLNLRFEDESVDVFNQRIKVAEKMRDISELFIRYHSRIDAIPTKWAPALPKASAGRILSRLGSSGDPQSIASLLRESDAAYQKAYAKYLFDATVICDRSLSEYLPCIPEKLPLQPLSRTRSLEVSASDMYGAHAAIEQNLPMANALIHEALLVLWESISKIREVTVMKWDLLRPETLDMFLRRQEHCRNAFLKEYSNSTLIFFSGVIVAAMQELPEEERYEEAPTFAKVVRLVNRMLNSAMEHATSTSILQYTDRICSCVSSNASPVFLTTLIASDGRFGFEPEIAELEQGAHSAAAECVDAMQHLPRVEVPLDVDIEYATVYLPTIDPDDPRVHECEKRLTDAFDTIRSGPLDAVIQAFDQYSVILSTNVDDYKASLPDRDADSIAEDIIMFRKLQQSAALDAPVSITSGPYLIECTSLKTLIWDSCVVLLELACTHLRKKAEIDMNERNQEFEVIVKKLKTLPTTPEELVDTKNYVAELQEREHDLVGRLNTMMLKFELLEDLRIESPERASFTRWSVYGMPAALQVLVDSVNVELVSLQERMIEQLRVNQRHHKEQLRDLAKQASEFDHANDIEDATKVGAEVGAMQAKIQESSNQWSLFNKHEIMFGFNATPNPDLEQLIKTFEPIHTLWSLASQWATSLNDWTTLPFSRLNPSQIESVMTSALRSLTRCIRVFRGHKDDPFNVSLKLRSQIEEFKVHFPIVSRLRHPGIRMRHWRQLAEHLGVPVDTFADFSLDFLLELHLEQHSGVVTSISDVAVQEYRLEQMLEKMFNELASQKIEFVPHQESGSHIARLPDDLFPTIDDQLLMVQTMLASPYIKPVEKVATRWQTTLRHVQDTLDVLVAVQRLWIYLRPIFTVGDIEKQLPNEAKKYLKVDADWIRVMKEGVPLPGVLDFCKVDGVLDRLSDARNALEAIVHQLQEYLEAKRVLFPRFYFLSNEELLDILSQTSNPHAVQPHLRKCFENIHRLDFTESFEAIAMTSAEGERVEFREAIDATQPVEHWLQDVEIIMRETLREVIPLAVGAYSTTEWIDWIWNWPAQAVMAATMIMFTHQVTSALGSRGHAVAGALKAVRDKIAEHLVIAAGLVRGKISHTQRLTLECLLVLEVHNRDTVDHLIAIKATDSNDFDWMAAMRYYLEKNAEGPDDCVVRMVNTAFDYGYEYLGTTTRLVITPLTARAFRTLLTALHMHLGCSPAGPAGTGKTETTKDLAKALAKQCIVYNCSEGLDHKSMGKFFKGLLSGGAWSCLDEFNRLDIEVLSVVAQQIFQIQQAIATRVEEFTFEGTHLTVDPTCAVYVTMNPGYVGRSELPDNLKALFRPLAMTKPDFRMICEILLFAEGYVEATALSSKIVHCFKLASFRLTGQSHYDFGMRSVKTVLRRAGDLKRLSPDESEDRLLLEALRVVNLPKLVEEDLPIFEHLLADLFPGVATAPPDRPRLMSTIHDVIKEKRLQEHPGFLRNVIQLLDTMSVRHGVVLIGATGQFKTATYEVLSEALCRLSKEEENVTSSEGKYRNVVVDLINPKAVTLGQLFGELNEISQEWQDGIIAHIVREAARDDSENPDSAAHRWMIFDGPMDTLWVENLNSVLDDSKLLCLTNGERIRMPDSMRLLFELDDIAQASPATISRCGMVLVDQKAAKWRTVAASWLDSLPQELVGFRDHFDQFLNSVVSGALHLVLTRLSAPFKLGETVLLQKLFQLFDALVEPVAAQLRRRIGDETKHVSLFGSKSKEVESEEEEEEEEEEKEEEEPEKNMHITDSQAIMMTESVLAFATVWALGGTTNQIGRVYFDTFLRSALSDFGAKNPFPDEGVVYDYWFDFKGENWQPWSQKVISRVAETTGSRVVPTADFERVQYFLDIGLNSHLPVCLFGPQGVGKTLAAHHKVLRELPSSHVTAFLSLSASVGANEAQTVIDSRLERRRKGVFGPPVNKRMALFVDDLHRPKLDSSGAQPPLELLRLYLGHGMWFEKRSSEKREIVDVDLLCAFTTAQPGNVPVRLLRHFMTVQISEPTDAILSTVARGSIYDYMQPFSEGVRLLMERAVEATIRVYRAAVERLRPTPSRSHYVFGPRNVLDVARGLVMIDPSSVNEAQVARLWVNECSRVMKDRLVDQADRDWFNGQMKMAGQQFLADVWHDIDIESIMFGGVSFESGNAYVEITSVPALVSSVQSLLDDYNGQTSHQIELALFEDNLSHILRVSRALKMQSGHLVMVGMDATEMEKLARLGAFIADSRVTEIEVTRTYGMLEWRDDLRRAVKMAGLDAVSVVMLLKYTQVKNERFLEDCENLMRKNDVPSLFDKEDTEIILQQMRMVIGTGLVPGYNAQAVGTMGREQVYAVFTDRVRENLHVVLCLNYVGSLYRTRMREFPGLATCSVIDFQSPWPSTVLKSLAHEFLSKMMKDDPSIAALLTGDLQERGAEFIVFMHTYATKHFEVVAGRQTYIAASDFLQLMETFKTLLRRRLSEVSAKVERLETGIANLGETSDQVNAMHRDLELLVPELKTSNMEMEALLQDLNKKNEDLATVRKDVSEEESTAQKEQGIAEKLFADADVILDKAMPALQEATEALSALSKSDIAEIRAMKHPPVKMVKVIESVCILLGRKPTKTMENGHVEFDYWPAALLMLNDVRFIQKLREFDKENISEDMINKLQKYVKDPEFEPELVEKISVAAAHLCAWVRALEHFYWVHTEVVPLREAQAEAAATLSATEERLQGSRDRMKAVDDEVAALQQSISDADDRKKNITQKVRDTQRKIERATRLLGALGGEAERWRENKEEAKVKIATLLADMLLAAGVVQYMGSLPPADRTGATSTFLEELKVRGFQSSEQFSLRECLVDDAVKIRYWHSVGLPNDHHSEENAAIVVEGTQKWPLLFDAQGQANRWVKAMYGKDKLAVTHPGDSQLMRTVENCVLFGQPLLIEDIGETIDPTLEPVLSRNIYEVDGRAMIRLGDNTVIYNKDFRLILTTRLVKPHYSPDVCAKVTIVNFSVTQEGLTDQLLALVLKYEREDLEKQRVDLIVETADNLRRKQELEDSILDQLADAQGDVLEDEALIETLGRSKETSLEIAQKVKDAEKTHIDINEMRQVYHPIAVRSAILYFSAVGMSIINSMYQFSLDWFFRVFEHALSAAAPSDVLEERLENLINALTYGTYENAWRSLFARDRLLFSFNMALRVMIGSGRIDPLEYTVFLSGSRGLVKKTEDSTLTRPEWIPENNWTEIVCSSAALGDVFAQLPFHVSRFSDDWKSYVLGQCAGKPPVPFDKLRPFHKLVLHRLISPDIVAREAQVFVANELGSRFVEPPATGLQEAFDDGDESVPMIFILSPGTDPMDDLAKFAQYKDMAGRLRVVSMGQGQGPVAAALIEEGAKQGLWVFLQNIHLIVSWLPELERILDKLTREMKGQIHKRFRLWLSLAPSDDIPHSMLQLSIKIVVEPPRGLRQSLLHIYQAMGDEEVEKRTDAAFHKLLFGLSFFHAAVQERARFGPLGWTTPYEFGSSDFEVSRRHLIEMLETVGPGVPPPYKALRYLIGELNYGGRLTNVNDRRVLNSMLEVFLTPKIRSSGYQFAKNRAYRAPDRGTLQHYIEHVRSMPLEDEPDVFGFHENATVSTTKNDTRLLLDGLTAFQARGSSAVQTKATDGGVVSEIDIILAQLPDVFDVERTVEMAQKRRGEDDDDDVYGVLIQELNLYNRLLVIIRTDLNELKQAFDGKIVMSKELDAVMESIFERNVPKKWASVAYPSTLSLHAWMDDLCKRCEFMRKWSSGIDPPIFWLGAFFRPRAFLSMQLQKHARIARVAVDELKFGAKVLSSDVTSPDVSIGFVASGIRMEAARWDSTIGKITDPIPGQLYDDFPPVHFVPQNLQPGDDTTEDGMFRCALYRTLERAGKLETTGESTNHILDLDFECSDTASKWDRGGVAAFCST